MYYIVKEFENKGIDIGRQETAAAISSTQAQCLISALEQCVSLISLTVSRTASDR